MNVNVFTRKHHDGLRRLLRGEPLHECEEPSGYAIARLLAFTVRVTLLDLDTRRRAAATLELPMKPFEPPPNLIPTSRHTVDTLLQPRSG